MSYSYCPGFSSSTNRVPILDLVDVVLHDDDVWVTLFAFTCLFKLIIKTEDVSVLGRGGEIKDDELWAVVNQGASQWLNGHGKNAQSNPQSDERSKDSMNERGASWPSSTKGKLLTHKIWIEWALVLSYLRVRLIGQEETKDKVFFLSLRDAAWYRFSQMP